MRNIRKTAREIMLLIISSMLLTGTLTPMVISQTGTPSTDITPLGLVTTTSVSYTMSFSENDLSFDTLFGYDTVTLNGCSLLNEIGSPQLPVKHIMIALPNSFKANKVRILSAQTQMIEGTFTILPAQKPQKLGTPPPILPRIQRNIARYLSPLPYPSQLVCLGTQTDLAGQNLLQLTIYPLHYLPLQKHLVLITSISFVIDGTPGYLCNDYLPHSISDNGRTMYEQMIQGLVINPGDVQLQSSPSTPQPLGVPPGDYDYVIVTQDSWVSAFQPLATWKTMKGVPATIVTTTTPKISAPKSR